MSIGPSAPRSKSNKDNFVVHITIYFYICKTINVWKTGILVLEKGEMH